MARFRVADVNDLFAWTGGGIRRYHLEKIRFFSKRDDLEYHLVIPSDKALIEVHGSARIHHVPGIPLGGGGYRVMANPMRLRKALQTIQPDLVEVGSPYSTPDWTRFALKGLDCPVVGFWHGNYPVVDLGRVLSHGGKWLGDLGEKLGWWWARRTYGDFTVTLAATNVMIDELNNHGIHRVRYTPLGVDTAMFHPRYRDPALREEWGAGPDDVVMIWPNRLATDKQYHHLFAAYELIRTRTNKKPIFIITGHGKGTPEAEALAARYPDRVKYLGYLENPRHVARIIASGDVSAALSPYETFGLAAVEAMACGAALLGSNSASVGDIIRECQCGIALPELTPEAMADAWLTLLDPAVARPLGHKGRQEAVARYSWKATFTRIQEVYQEVLQESARQKLATGTALLPPPSGLAGPV